MKSQRAEAVRWGDHHPDRSQRQPLEETRAVFLVTRPTVGDLAALGRDVTPPTGLSWRQYAGSEAGTTAPGQLPPSPSGAFLGPKPLDYVSPGPPASFLVGRLITSDPPPLARIRGAPARGTPSLTRGVCLKKTLPTSSLDLDELEAAAFL